MATAMARQCHPMAPCLTPGLLSWPSPPGTAAWPASWGCCLSDVCLLALPVLWRSTATCSRAACQDVNPPLVSAFTVVPSAPMTVSQAATLCAGMSYSAPPEGTGIAWGLRVCHDAPRQARACMLWLPSGAIVHGGSMAHDWGSGNAGPVSGRLLILLHARDRRQDATFMGHMQGQGRHGILVGKLAQPFLEQQWT